MFTPFVRQIVHFGVTLVLLCNVAAAEELCNIARSAIQAASQLRKLEIKKDVPCYVRDKEAVTNHLLELVNSKIPADRMKLEGWTYTALGFIPESFDYERGLIDLYVSQLGGYYDPEKKFFVMAAWMPAMMQTSIAVHELTHALQDQYFDLEAFVDPRIDNSDLLLARSALVEGDATWIMLDYMRNLMGQGSIAELPNVESVMMQNVMGGAMVTQTQGVPQSLQLTLIFPYTSGLRFAHTLLRRDGVKAIDAAFKNSPKTTEEILHPEIYPSEVGRHFVQFSDTDFQLDPAVKVIHRDTIGEFGIVALLGMLLEDKNQITAAASGWGGDRLVVYETNGKRSLKWRLHWDTARDAKEFYTAYAEPIKKLYPNGGVTVELKESDVFVSIERELK